MKHYLHAGLLLFSCFLCTCAPPPAKEAATKSLRPNVPLIAADDLRPEPGACGHGMIHPLNLDRLAARIARQK